MLRHAPLLIHSTNSYWAFGYSVPGTLEGRWENKKADWIHPSTRALRAWTLLMKEIWDWMTIYFICPNSASCAWCSKMIINHISFTCKFGQEMIWSLWLGKNCTGCFSKEGEAMGCHWWNTSWTFTGLVAQRGEKLGNIHMLYVCAPSTLPCSIPEGSSWACPSIRKLHGEGQNEFNQIWGAPCTLSVQQHESHWSFCF